MKAWEFEHKLTADAVPPELHDDNEADWMAYTEAGRASDKQLFHDWDNKVPGSKAPDRKSTRLNSSHRSLSRMPSSA